MTEEMVIDNFEFYNDSGIASVDTFKCLYQPGMCESGCLSIILSFSYWHTAITWAGVQLKK